MPLAEGCLTRAQLRELAAAVLRAAGTDAGDRVYEPRDWPTDSSLFPALLVQAPSERKESLGRTVPQFNAVVTLAVLARVEASSEAEAEAAIDALCGQVEEAVLCAPDLVRQVQQFAWVETQLVVSAEGEAHVGEAAILFGCEVFQLFEPAPGEALFGIDMTANREGKQALAAILNLPQE